VSSLAASSLLIVATLLAAGWPGGDGVVSVFAFRVEHDGQHPSCLGGANQHDPSQIALKRDGITVTDLLYLTRVTWC
jgi:hypothetical protein